MTEIPTKPEKQTRTHLSASQKTAIVRRHLGAKRESVADLAVEHGVPPGSIYPWVQRLFDNGDVAIETKPHAERQAVKQAEQKATACAVRLAKKDQAIAELLTQLLELK